jgi:hypothetical protein
LEGDIVDVEVEDKLTDRRVAEAASDRRDIECLLVDLHFNSP